MQIRKSFYLLATIALLTACENTQPSRTESNTISTLNTDYTEILTDAASITTYTSYSGPSYSLEYDGCLDSPLFYVAHDLPKNTKCDSSILVDVFVGHGYLDSNIFNSENNYSFKLTMDYQILSSTDGKQVSKKQSEITEIPDFISDEYNYYSVSTYDSDGYFIKETMTFYKYFTVDITHYCTELASNEIGLILFDIKLYNGNGQDITDDHLNKYGVDSYYMFFVNDGETIRFSWAESEVKAVQ